MKGSYPSKPQWMTAGAVLGLTLLPFFLNLAGYSFDTRLVTFAPDGLSEFERMHFALHGSFVHSILEWTAVFTAVFTTLLAFLYFHVNRDRVVLVIAAALLCGGIMDAFHILSSTVIHAAKDSVNFGPFTWAVSRLFTAAVIVFSATVVLFKRGAQDQGSRRGIWIPFALMAFVSWLTIRVCTSFEVLPQTMFAANVIKRPFDLVTLILFSTVVPYVLYRVYRRYPGTFSSSLLLSLIPQIGAQLYMVFSSSARYDNGSMCAHYLKILAYLVPLGGICAQFVIRLRAERDAMAGMIQTQKLAFLGQLSAGAAHEINNPLTVVKGLSEILEHKAKSDRLSNDDVIRISKKINQNADRIVRIVSSLKILAGEKRGAARMRVSVKDLIERTLDLTRASAGNESIDIQAPAVEEDLFVAGDQADFAQILLNLIQNALNALEGADQGEIRLSVSASDPGFVTVSVEDNGPGIPPEHVSRLFTPFFTTRDVGTGAGLGLSTSRNLAQRYNGELSFTRYSPGVKISLKLPRTEFVRESADVTPEQKVPRAS